MIKSVNKIKTYQKFCALTVNPKTKKGGLDTKNYLDGNKIYRYGLQIDVAWVSFTGQKKINFQS